MKIIFHADDYGMNAETSREILECCDKGVLNSLSVLANGFDFEEGVKRLEKYRDKVKISMHLNVAEGHCLAAPERVPLLVDEKGMFCVPFFKMLLLSFGPKRRQLEQQLYREMEAQVEKLLPVTASVRLDSHQHYHLIPGVLKSILRVVEKKGLEVEFIRVPAEPIGPFLKHWKFYRTYRPINFVKNVVLNTLYLMDYKSLLPYRKKTAVFFGILLSGRMDYERVKELLPDFLQIAEKRGLPLEVLAHPGRTEAIAHVMAKEDRGCVNFYMGEGRSAEKEMMMKISGK